MTEGLQDRIPDQADLSELPLGKAPNPTIAPECNYRVPPTAPAPCASFQVVMMYSVIVRSGRVLSVVRAHIDSEVKAQSLLIRYLSTDICH